jgi:ubiquitin-like modifier-activating enzyme ATG7
LPCILIQCNDFSFASFSLNESNFESILQKNISCFWFVISDSFSNNTLSWYNRNILAFLFALYTKHKVGNIIDLICSENGNHVWIQLDATLKSFDFSVQPKIVGWELNERGKPGPQSVNLAASLDTTQLMTQAIDLNIRLMKWRQWPSLQNEEIAQTRCLLFGSGTLGCAIARALLGWGIKNVTLVDNGRVSYSNPTRQCLFEYNDCVENKYKSVAAADRLRAIYPLVNAKGVVCDIPMPGHAFNESISFDSTVDELDSLVQDHDVIFNVTDSREARWLPTVLSACYNKLMINVALCFDTFLAMRHGIESLKKEGCYFCSDIIAATNSMKDRTMDQQCTVTRPGSSFISSGLAVELMVSYLQSKYDDKLKVPHQIRGNLQGFTQILPETPAFECCIACSEPIVNAYRQQKTAFVRQVCLSPEVLPEISGINAMTLGVNLDDPLL